MSGEPVQRVALPGEEPEGLPFYVLYRFPRDFPWRYVVRRQVAGSEIVFDRDPIVVSCCRSVACDAFPAARYGLHWMPRHPSDDPVIQGYWF